MGLTAGDADPRRAHRACTLHRTGCRADWRAVAVRADEHGHGVGALPMARGAPVDARAPRHRVLQLPLHGAPLERSPTRSELVTGAYVTRLVWSSSVGRVTSVEYVDRRTGEREQVRGRRRRPRGGRDRLHGDPAAFDARTTSRTGSATRPGSSGATCTTIPASGGRSRSRTPHDRARAPGVHRPAPITPTASRLMATSLTVGMTESVRDRLRTFYGGRSTRFGVQVLGTMVPTPDAGVVLGAWEGSRPATSPALRRSDREEHGRGPRAGSRGVGVGRDRRRRAGAVPRAGARLVGALRGFGAGCTRTQQFGVLDRWNRMYDVPNVAVVDPSCFPTGPEKNPTLTAMALGGTRRRPAG